MTSNRFIATHTPHLRAAVALLTSRSLNIDFRPAAELPAASLTCSRSLYRNAPSR